MLSKNQVSNLITFYNENVDEMKRLGWYSELDEFDYHFQSFLECIDCNVIFDENHVVDIVEW